MATFYGKAVKYSHASMATPAKGMEILSGTSSPEFAREVARRVGIPFSGPNVYKDSSNETHADMTVSVRGRDVFILQTGYSSSCSSDLIMETLILCYACKTSSARKIIGVIPYLPYSKQCIMKRRGCITAKLLASMLSRAGMCHLVTMDLYHKEVQGFFDFPVDNLRASPFLIQYITDNVPEYKNGVVVARYPGVTRRANAFAERLRLNLAVISGEVKREDGRNSPPPFDSHTPNRTRVTEKEKPPLNVVGDVDGKIALLIDDVIDEADNVIAAAQCLKDNGAQEIYVIATHAILPDNSPELLEESCIHQVLVTNTIPQDDHSKRCSKLKTIDISVMLAEAIRRIYHGESMSYLFKNIPLED